MENISSYLKLNIISLTIICIYQALAIIILSPGAPGLKEHYWIYTACFYIPYIIFILKGEIYIRQAFTIINKN